MIEFFKLYGLTTVIFLGIDSVWLTLIAKNFYAEKLGYLMASKPNLLAALLFYLINIVGIVTLVLIPALREQSMGKLILLAAIYGLCTYATYDLTNLATIKNWPMVITVIDLIWGTVLTTGVSLISYLIARKFF